MQLRPWLTQLAKLALLRLQHLLACTLLVLAPSLPHAAEVNFDFLPQARFGTQLVAHWPGVQVRASGLLRVTTSRRRTLDRTIAGVWLIASARSGWSIPEVEDYLATLTVAMARCGIGLADTPLVLLGSFPSGADGAVHDDTWVRLQLLDGLAKQRAAARGTRFSQRSRLRGSAGAGLPLQQLVLFADRFSSPFAQASIGGFANFYKPLPHVIIARHDQRAEVFAPEWTLAHEFAHHLLGPAHDAPDSPTTIMASHSCAQCSFSVAQCERMRRQLPRPS